MQQGVEPEARIYVGAAICEGAVLLIAIGANIQRYALDRISARESLLCACVSKRFTVWILGLAVYFTANILYTIALVFAPAALCATLMATIVPINAATSRLILGETLQLVDVQGGLLITAGISLAAWAAPYRTDTYTAVELQRLLFETDALVTLMVLSGACLLLAAATLAHESGCCAASLRGVMPFAYPVVIGLLESLVTLAQKGGSSMLALTLAGHSQLEARTFWVDIAAWVVTSVLVVWSSVKKKTILGRSFARRLEVTRSAAKVSSSERFGMMVFLR